MLHGYGHTMRQGGRTRTPTLPLSTGRGGLEGQLATKYGDTFLRWLLPAVLICMGIAGPARAASKFQVDEALQRAKAYLYSIQNSSGNWESVPAPLHLGDGSARGRSDEVQWGGLTALATYALIASGESPNEPKLTRAIAFLKSSRFFGTYALAMRCQVWMVLPQDDDVRRHARADASALEHGLITEGPGRGFYNYVSVSGAYQIPNWSDLSNGQMAVLGVWAADQACYPGGVAVPQEYWQTVDQAWRGAQYQNGGWPYSVSMRRFGLNEEARMSMTAAGVATLFITQDYLQRQAGLECRDTFTDTAAEAGMGYLSDNLADLLVSEIPDCYTLYGMERIGAASGRRYFGLIDWYARGASYLLLTQGPGGDWGPDDPPIPAGQRQGFPHNPQNIPNTCFAMVFLSRGQAPVAIGKLQYGDSTAWNQRPRDAANVTRWLGYETEKYLNWQSFGLDRSVDELHDAAMLYIAGNGPIAFDDAEIARLKQYIEEGGILVGNADCGGKAFTASFEALGTRMFPNYRFRVLSAGNLIQAGEIFKPRAGRQTITLRGMSNGVRELMLLLPTDDGAKMWQSQQVLQRPEAFQVMENILVYATDKLAGLSVRGVRAFPPIDVKLPAKGKIKMARLKFNGNWDPEPAGWRRMAAVLHNESRVDLDVQAVDLNDGFIDSSNALASLTGTGSFQLTDAGVAAITNYLHGGGTLVIDPAGGDGGFADSAESMLKKLFPDQPPKTPAWDEPGLTVQYRTFDKIVVGANKSARVRSYNIGGRAAVFYSPDDLSAGLVGEEIDGIRGYEPETASELMLKVIHAAAPKAFGP